MPNLQQRIVSLLKGFPANLEKPCDELLEELADDIQAEVIKALGEYGRAAAIATPADVELEHAVEDIWVDSFGVRLSNLVTTVDFPHKRNLPYPIRCDVVKAMIRLLLREQAAHTL